MCLQKLLTAARYGLLRPEELVGQLAIREAMAEVISCSCRHTKAAVSLSLWRPLAMAALHYSGPKLIKWHYYLIFIFGGVKNSILHWPVSVFGLVA